MLTSDDKFDWELVKTDQGLNTKNINNNIYKYDLKAILNMTL